MFCARCKAAAMCKVLLVGFVLNCMSASVQFVSLEKVCAQYLSNQAHRMQGHALYCLAQLADHLGLSALLEAAAEALIKQPWEHNMKQLSSMLQITLYREDTSKRNRLLHHPQRGAYTELQVLELVESLDVADSDCAAAVDLERLQPAELHVLLAVLADAEHGSTLLRKAVQQLLVPEALRQPPDWTKHVRIMHNIMLPESGTSDSYIHLPRCIFKLRVERSHHDGKTHLTASCFLNDIF